MDYVILIEIIGAIVVVVLDLVAIALAVSRSHGAERTLLWVFVILLATEWITGEGLPIADHVREHPVAALCAAPFAFFVRGSVSS